TLPSGVPSTSRLLSGDPASSLVAELKKGEHELVVLSTHGRTGVAHLLLGSIAEKLVRLSPVPVLTVPVPGRG
ncbi:MAG TPA: universal stress protein, partial [Polyangiaceae bacterium]